MFKGPGVKSFLIDSGMEGSDQYSQSRVSQGKIKIRKSGDSWGQEANTAELYAS